jgi:hypothetical protein
LRNGLYMFGVSKRRLCFPPVADLPARGGGGGFYIFRRSRTGAGCPPSLYFGLVPNPCVRAEIAPGREVVV